MDKGQEGEDYVNKITYNSFLKYWCFPGPLDITGDNKEICDLLILFKETLILVSVKNYALNRDNYERYFRRTVDKAVKQLKGAERKLFGDRPILLKHPNRSEILFPKEDITNIYRVVVNLNSEVRYYRTSFFENGFSATIMDSEAWLGVVRELNTIPDFVSYLNARNNLFNSFPTYIMPRAEYEFDIKDMQAIEKELNNNIVSKSENLSLILGSELDLIATYIINGFKFPEKLVHDESRGLMLKIDGEWERYNSSDLAKQLRDIEEDGYFIERLIKEVFNETDEAIKIAEILYSLNRLQRTIFFKRFMEYYEDIVDHSPNVEYNRTHYVEFGINLVLVCYSEEISPMKLENIINLSILHHAYLHNFEVKDIGVIGVSKKFYNYSFGYGDGTQKPSGKDYAVMINAFKKLGWKLNDADS